MPNIFTKWLRRRRAKHRKQLPDPPMPILPQEISRRPLTAAPCSPAATENSFFFQRIPPEIRRNILIEAFGELPVHFDLHLLHPPKKNKGPQTGGLRHANLPGSEERDCSKPRRWEWCGSVCHHLRPAAQRTSPENTYSADRDICHMGCGSKCLAWPGETPTKCFIGITGWLLTCRQAYIEGVDVLYATNRILIRGTYLLYRLPDLLLLQRRTEIRTVELCWDIDPWRDTAPSAKPRIEYQDQVDMQGLSSLLRALPATLPNLTSIYIALNGGFLPPGVRNLQLSEVHGAVLKASETLLQPVDQMVTKLHHLTQCHILLPSSHFRAHKFEAKGIGFSIEHLASDEPLWRALPDQNRLQQDKGMETSLKGYWLCAGKHDWFHPDDYIEPPLCGCF